MLNNVTTVLQYPLVAETASALNPDDHKIIKNLQTALDRRVLHKYQNKNHIGSVFRMKYTLPAEQRPPPPIFASGQLQHEKASENSKTARGK